MIVLDASALLAALHAEPGHETVADLLDDSCMSAVNLAEIVTHFVRIGRSAEDVERRLESLPIAWIAFDPEHAHIAGALVRETRAFGLSLGDRACLALAISRNSPAYTADRAWMKLDLPIEIRLIR